MKQIPLTRGHFAIVDDEDFEYLSQFNWTASINSRTGRVYAVRGIGRHPNRRTRSMHREILGLAEGDPTQGEHENGNSLDNRRDNLRTANQAQNNANRKLNRRNRSGFFGVSWDSNKKKWRAGISVDFHHKFLGNFDDKEEAARARDTAAKKYFGTFARLNFPGLTSGAALA